MTVPNPRLELSEGLNLTYHRFVRAYALGNADLGKTLIRLALSHLSVNETRCVASAGFPVVEQMAQCYIGIGDM